MIDETGNIPKVGSIQAKSVLVGENLLSLPVGIQLQSERMLGHSVNALVAIPHLYIG